MRPRFNRNAICSSDNYKASKRAHTDMLKERHNHFTFMAVSCKDNEVEVTIDTPKVVNGHISDKLFKTIRIRGKMLRLEIDEYKYLKGIGLIKED